MSKLIRHRLRSRIVFSMLLFGTLLSALFALSALLLQEYVTDQLISDTLREEVDQYLRQLRVDPTSAEPFYSRIEGFVTRPGQADIVPIEFRDLPSGVHEVSTARGEFRAAVRKADDFWVFLTYDVTSNQQITRQLWIAMVLVVLGFSLLSLLLGQWSAGRVMRPVSDLANRVRAMSGSSKPEALAPHFANDEVGELAQALDHYIEQLRDRAERDQAFNADVSHELRTPLAVIIGATELLQSMPDLPDKAQPRLLRIARAARQTVDITTALLYLARAERGVTDESNARDVTAITADVVEQYRPLLGSKPLRIETELDIEVNVIAPESVLAVTIGNLLGNAIRYTPEGVITVLTAPGRVEICDQGPGIDADDMPHVFDRHYRAADRSAANGKTGSMVSASGSGLGLAIVKRLASLYGWDIELKNRPQGGLSATIWFYGQSP